MNKEKKLIELFEKWAGEQVEEIVMLPRSGSYREYYRLKSSSRSALGVYNEDFKENKAFISFTRHFYNKKIKVPEIYAEDLSQHIYLQQDLGDITLFAFLNDHREGAELPEEVINIYKKIVSDLPLIQIDAGRSLDYSVCYPRASFDKQSMRWDLNYFKYYFLKLAKIPFDEQLLEDDFRVFYEYLLQADREYFLYRDFQSRNIMIYHGEPYYIDYQGGRKGALHYDLASLLYDAKADLPQQIREELLDHYLVDLQKIIPVDVALFKQFYQGYILIRIMQAMGAYGFRGFYEKKTHFLQSIPYALDNLSYILRHLDLPIKIPHLKSVLNLLVDSPRLRQFRDFSTSSHGLQVTINSFSYKKGLPVDESGNGGGFVFDCRGMHNPGRYESYKNLSGQDVSVIEFLKSNSQIEEFLEHVFEIVDMTVDNYISRDFDHLMISFGCTGGQHRSVFSAEALSAHLQEKYNIRIKLRHRELEKMHLNSKKN
ncbi:MAG: RapZ C-terminal domain-containing protein [Cyclobacteriaceae bacterium]